MIHDIIKTNNYLIIVDDSEIKEGDCTYHPIKGLYKAVADGSYTNKKKVIAHLPLNISPVLEGVDLLLPLEDESERLAELEFPNLYQPMKGIDTPLLLREGFIEGYNKAKEKYKWTDEDVIKIVEKSRETGLTAEYLLLSLSQPKYPIAFEQEDEVIKEKHTSVTIKSDGYTIWIGKYIY